MQAVTSAHRAREKPGLSLTHDSGKQVRVARGLVKGPTEQGGQGRTDVVDIFPDSAAIVRLAAAVLAEQNDECTEQRRYMVTEILTAFQKAGRKPAPVIPT